jgi:hypothetical protein
MRSWLKFAQIALLSSFGFYLLVVAIDLSRLGDSVALLWASGIALGAMGVSGALFLVLWIADLMQRKNEGPQS